MSEKMEKQEFSINGRSTEDSISFLRKISEERKKDKELIKKLEKNIIRGKVENIMMEFAEEYHKKKQRELLIEYEKQQYTMHDWVLAGEQCIEGIDDFLKNRNKLARQ